MALILEEYTPTELKLAVTMLRNSGRSGILLDYVASERQHSSRKPKKTEKPASGRNQASLSGTKSRAISKLEEIEPEKFVILREFENLIQAGEVLKTNEAVRNLGERTSKKFVAKKSRKESIAALLGVLAEGSMEDVRNVIEAAIAPDEPADGDQYQRLADFLIKGKG
ncbi:hypothetical protein [Sphingobium ummariense]